LNGKREQNPFKQTDKWSFLEQRHRSHLFFSTNAFVKHLSLVVPSNMPSGNGAKAACRRERVLKDQPKEAKSQLKANAAAMNIQCKV
jgi:predicted GIY-YIG superfamily endonuclease